MPSHYLNQCWVIVIWSIRNKLRWNFISKYKNFHLQKSIWKHLLQDGIHFVKEEMSNSSSQVFRATLRVNGYINFCNGICTLFCNVSIRLCHQVWVDSCDIFTKIHQGYFTYIKLLWYRILVNLSSTEPQKHSKTWTLSIILCRCALHMRFWLIHCSQDKMAAIFLKTFSKTFSWMRMYIFRLRFHWCLFPWQYSITGSDKWLGAGQTTGHYLSQ